MSPEELGYLATVGNKSHTIVEIGSWKGRSTLAFGLNTTGVVFAVDTWQGRLEHDAAIGMDQEFLNDFLNNTQDLWNVIPIPVESVKAAIIFGFLGVRFDVIFIDATHTYEACSADIKAWRPLLKDTGILCGHDYSHKDWPGVKQAVDELVPKFRVIGTIWTTEE